MEIFVKNKNVGQKKYKIWKMEIFIKNKVQKSLPDFQYHLPFLTPEFL